MTVGGSSNADWLARWETLAAEHDTIVDHDPHETIVPSRRSGHPIGDRALELLNRLTRSPGTGDEGAVRLGETIGEGGMGIVHLGVQIALDREVAVKRLRPEHRTDSTTLKLLREAWITGGLQHPNIVPVYDLALDREGHPTIVLKMIEGVSWAEVMHDEAVVRQRFRARNLLEWNLSVLMQVCNAIHFAHSRNIVHRDLKPENVMLGEFGEVYVVDWGIAVSTEDDGSGRLPLASEARQLAGTPCYMAPEMLGGEEPAITERSDVYLLGAVLHEILTGLPPHVGESLMDIVRSIMTRQSDWPETVSPELARICDRAMDKDADARFETAEQLRLALEGYLRHRGSALLALEADERLGQLEDELDESNEDPTSHRLHLYNLYGEARFGFRQALRQWRDNEAAQSGIVRATEVMIHYELGQDDPKAASLLLAELPEPPVGLSEEVAAALAKKDAERARIAELERLGRQLDPNLGKRTRLFLAAILGTLWTIGPVATELIRGGEGSYLEAAIAPALFLLLSLTLGVWARESMTRTLINRRVLGTVVFALVEHLIFLVAANMLELPLEATHAVLFFTWFCLSSMMAIYMDLRLIPTALGYLGASFLAIARPSWFLYAMSMGHFVLTVNLIVLWWTPIRRQPGEEPPP